jgi:hypothetical protein
MAKLYGQDAIKWALANPDQARSYLNGSAASGSLTARPSSDKPFFDVPVVGGVLSGLTAPI